jgi:predicted Zn-dependent protease
MKKTPFNKAGLSAVTAGFCLVFFLAGCAVMRPYRPLQEKPRSEGTLMPDNFQEEISEKAAEELEGMFGLWDDPGWQERVAAIGAQITAQSPRQDVDYRFAVLDGPALNAVSLMDGRIYVMRGLCEFIKDDDELAGVLAHEVAHITGYHLSNAIMRNSLLLQVSELVSRQERTAEEEATLKQASIAFLDHGMGRQAEFEADHLGVIYCQAAAYDPRGLLHLLERLAEYESAGGGVLKYAFHPHPAAVVRLAQVRRQLLDMGYVLEEESND